MRRLFSFLLASSVTTTVFVEACDAYDAEPATPVADAGDAGAEATDAGDEAAPDAASDASACTGEPDWATPTSATTTAVCGGETVDLLADSRHCGRCDHPCAQEACVQGTCAERNEDGEMSLPEAVHDGALFYSTRPGGSIGSLPHRLKRIVPGSAPVVLGILDADASNESRVLSATVSGADVYVRTNASLRRTSASLPNTAVPSLVAKLPVEAVSSVVAAPDRIYVTLPAGDQIHQVFFDGGSAPFATASSPVDSALAGARYVWLSQPFALFEAGPSSVHVHEGATDKVLYESSDRIAGIAIDGDDLFVMRAATGGGAIMRIDLASGAVVPFFEGDLDTPIISMSVAVDATHVYWLKGTVGTPVEIWKRARCGGAAVRIGTHAFIYRVRVVGDRLYFGAEDGLFSIAK